MSQYNDLLVQHKQEDEARLAHDIATVLKIREGRSFLMFILGKGGVFRFSRQDDNLNYVAGRRDLALEIFQAANKFAAKATSDAQAERNAILEDRLAKLHAAATADRMARPTL